MVPAYFIYSPVLVAVLDSIILTFWRNMNAGLFLLGMTDDIKLLVCKILLAGKFSIQSLFHSFTKYVYNPPPIYLYCTSQWSCISEQYRESFLSFFPWMSTSLRKTNNEEALVIAMGVMGVMQQKHRALQGPLLWGFTLALQGCSESGVWG